ncbi:hypothetical protein [Nostoc parmelioides]|uniref:Uncharacterized protein n=1 Tax=Nostoc parmelioides FACHB-3921 TaxID=2692909 RepID=A0ABR8BJN4_9NOSO|nr:hypothetical protein [Nostoc parmelioides]MBD2253769.1 hypothetical protein [Nostoc parmelioides FACHB-3921]
MKQADKNSTHKGIEFCQWSVVGSQWQRYVKTTPQVSVGWAMPTTTTYISEIKYWGIRPYPFNN